jgi:DNA integrity scanning protein DisA with diadenylate cyclase activity
MNRWLPRPLIAVLIISPLEERMSHKADSHREGLESRSLVEAAVRLAGSLQIRTLLVQADELPDIRSIEGLRGTERIVWLTRRGDLPLRKGSKDPVIRLPHAKLNRISEIRIGLLLAVLTRHVDLTETVLCLSGVAGSERLDTLLIANPQRGFPWLQKDRLEKTQAHIATREFARILEVALRLAAEGREGKAIGTAFVLGDVDPLSPYLRQLILNPCKGHPKKDRNIHEPDFFETIRELAALDGAFVVDRKGVVESAGTYLVAPASKKARVRPGLGTRHAASAAITAQTDALAVVVSGSSGTVTVFHEGHALIELEKPVP